MNILVLTSLFPVSENPQKGIFVYNMLKGIGDRVKFFVVVPKPYFLLKRKKVNKEVEEHFKQQLLDTLPNVENIIYIDYPFLPRIFHPIFSFLLYHRLKKLFKLIDIKKFDLLHSHFLFPEGVIAAKLGKDFSIKTICTVHGSDVNVMAHRLYWKPFLSYALRNLAGIIFVSENLKEKFLYEVLKNKNFNELNFAVIPNGFADWVVPSGEPSDEHLVRELRGQNKRIILFVGNLVKVKRVDLANEALAYAKGKVNNVVLLIIGAGPEEFRVKSKAAKLCLQEGKDFILMGRIAHKRVLFWIKEADLLILTSDNEGMPSVVLESLSLGTPVVATTVGGVPEVIVDGVNGFLCRKNDPVDIGMHLVEALSYPWDMERIKSSVKRYALSYLCEQFYLYYKSLIGAK